MDKNKEFKRRQFLKAAFAGVCGAALAAIVGADKLKASTPGAQKGLVKAAPSVWFEKLENKKIRCRLCPRECELSDGQRAPCRVRENRNGEGYTLVYGNPALIQEDPVERKPFFHVLPGTRALSVSTAGCNLECKFCEVWDMALAEPEEIYAYDMPPEAVLRHAVETGVQSLSYAFGEPVAFYEYMLETASLGKKEGLFNLVHTAGYINPGPLKKLCGTIDAANVDLKSFDQEFYRDVVGGELEPVLNTLKILREEGVHIEITNILIPELNDDMEMIKKMCNWILTRLGPEVPLHFARFYPLYKLSALPRTPVSTLDKARNTAMEAGLNYVYISRVTGHEGENTFCPGCGRKIIDRVGFVVDEVKIQNSRCEYCGAYISGKWG